MLGRSQLSPTNAIYKAYMCVEHKAFLIRTTKDTGTNNRNNRQEQLDKNNEFQISSCDLLATFSTVAMYDAIVTGLITFYKSR